MARLLAVVVALLLAGCGEPATLSPGTAPGTAGPGGAEITIRDYAYGPELTVAPGTVVTVRNADPVVHTLTADDGSFRTGEIPPGGTATFSAPAALGRHVFGCGVHTLMRGVLTVGTDPATPTVVPSSGAPAGPGGTPAEPGRPPPRPGEPGTVGGY